MTKINPTAAATMPTASAALSVFDSLGSIGTYRMFASLVVVIVGELEVPVDTELLPVETSSN